MGPDFPVACSVYVIDHIDTVSVRELSDLGRSLVGFLPHVDLFPAGIVNNAVSVEVFSNRQLLRLRGGFLCYLRFRSVCRFSGRFSSRFCSWLDCRFSSRFRCGIVLRSGRNLSCIICLSGFFINRIDEFALYVSLCSVVVDFCPHFPVVRADFVHDHPDIRTLWNAFIDYFLCFAGRRTFPEIDFVACYAVPVQYLPSGQFIRFFRYSCGSRCGGWLFCRFCSRCGCRFFRRFFCRFSGRFFRWFRCGFLCRFDRGINRSGRGLCVIVFFAFRLTKNIDEAAAHITFFAVVKHFCPAIIVVSCFIGNHINICSWSQNVLLGCISTWTLSEIYLCVCFSILIDIFTNGQITCIPGFRYRLRLCSRLCRWFCFLCFRGSFRGFFCWILCRCCRGGFSWSLCRRSRRRLSGFLGGFRCRLFCQFRRRFFRGFRSRLFRRFRCRLFRRFFYGFRRFHCFRNIHNGRQI